MTAITAPRSVRTPRAVRTTAFERTLLGTAAYLDHVVAARVARRATRDHAHSTAASEQRTTAQAMGGVGMLPR